MKIMNKKKVLVRRLRIDCGGPCDLATTDRAIPSRGPGIEGGVTGTRKKNKIEGKDLNVAFGRRVFRGGQVVPRRVSGWPLMRHGRVIRGPTNCASSPAALTTTSPFSTTDTPRDHLFFPPAIINPGPNSYSPTSCSGPTSRHGVTKKTTPVDIDQRSFNF